MENFKRYAVYYAPPAGAFAQAAAAWLGWDAEAGQELTPPDLGLPVAEITQDPRKYGFHGTIKPPFRLAEERSFDALHAAMQSLAARLQPVTLQGLELRRLGGFIALIPKGDSTPLQDLAAEVVKYLDDFRAPLNAAEIAKRRPEHLSPRQKALLDLWGYPYVLEEFRFHLTLTVKNAPPEAQAILAEYFAPLLPEPFEIKELCLFGEADDGRFHLIHRYPLSSSSSRCAKASSAAPSL